MGHRGRASSGGPIITLIPQLAGVRDSQEWPTAATSADHRTNTGRQLTAENKLARVHATRSRIRFPRESVVGPPLSLKSAFKSEFLAGLSAARTGGRFDRLTDPNMKDVLGGPV